MMGMRRIMRMSGVALGLAGIVGLGAGCEDAAKRPVQARVPATVPGPQTAQAAASAPGPLHLPPLPLGAASHPLLWLSPQIAGAQDQLIAKVEERFASGQQNYKAGHLEAA